MGSEGTAESLWKGTACPLPRPLTDVGTEVSALLNVTSEGAEKPNTQACTVGRVPKAGRQHQRCPEDPLLVTAADGTGWPPYQLPPGAPLDPECGTFTELTTSDLFVLISLVFTSTRPGSHTHQSQTPSAERSTQEVQHASHPRDVNCKPPLPDPSCRHLPSHVPQEVACRAGWAAQRLVVTAGGHGQEVPAGTDAC